MITKLKTHINKKFKITGLNETLDGQIGTLKKFIGKSYVLIELERLLICHRNRLKRVIS